MINGPDAPKSEYHRDSKATLLKHVFWNGGRRLKQRIVSRGLYLHQCNLQWRYTLDAITGDLVRETQRFNLSGFANFCSLLCFLSHATSVILYSVQYFMFNKFWWHCPFEWDLYTKSWIPNILCQRPYIRPECQCTAGLIRALKYAQSYFYMCVICDLKSCIYFLSFPLVGVVWCYFPFFPIDGVWLLVHSKSSVLLMSPIDFNTLLDVKLGDFYPPSMFFA